LEGGGEVRAGFVYAGILSAKEVGPPELIEGVFAREQRFISTAGKPTACVLSCWVGMTQHALSCRSRKCCRALIGSDIDRR
jgi:hypothetical protein